MQNRIVWMGVAASVAAGACGDTNDNECVPGDASRPDVVCSVEGRWAPRSLEQPAPGGASSLERIPPAAGQGAMPEGGASDGSGAANAGAGGSSGVLGMGGASAGTSTGSGPSAGTSIGGAPATPACLSSGELNCNEIDQCCPDSTCIIDGNTVVCAAICSGAEQCASGCCVLVNETTAVCAPASYCPPPVQQCTGNEQCASQCCLPIDTQTAACAPAALCAPPASVACTNVVLLANDGTFLGQATSNTFATDGVCNEFSQYGSQFAATSIFNEFGQYGSQFSSLSAYNQFTSTPPVLYCVTSDTVLNQVSKNTILAGAIDPDTLCAVLAANGL